MPTDFSNPLKIQLPYNFNSLVDYPTEILASRFQSWRTILKDLINYLKEYANVEEEIVRQQLRLQQAVGLVGGSSSPSGSTTAPISLHHTNRNAEEAQNANRFFVASGNGLIQDLPLILSKFHQQNVTNGLKTLKEINNVIVPKLDELRRDLLIKIKEIKNLQNDFKTNLGKEVQETRVLLSQYQQAIELSNKLENHLSGKETISTLLHHHLLEGDQLKFDPYLIKLKLDRQLKKQLQEENYLYEAYANLQNSGGKLESIVVLEIQNYLLKFLALVETEHSSVPNYLLPSINNGFLTKEATFEWDSFINRNLPGTINKNSKTESVQGTFIDLNFPARKTSDLFIPNYNTALNVSVRKGALERRSKYLKSYSSAWYVLTCNYFHEFKTADRKKDPIPVLSIPLDQCSVSEHLKDDGKAGGAYKFVLYLKGLNIRHRSHNWVFRTTTYQDMINWYNDIKNLTSLATPAARARFVAKRIVEEGGVDPSKKLSRTSSILSQDTNARTIHSVAAHLVKSKTSKASRLLHSTSRAAASIAAGGNRLSPTYSQRESNSPHLSNMINSDGTIITPVVGDKHTDEDVKSERQADLSATNVSPVPPVDAQFSNRPVTYQPVPETAWSPVNGQPSSQLNGQNGQNGQSNGQSNGQPNVQQIGQVNGQSTGTPGSVPGGVPGPQFAQIIYVPGQQPQYYDPVLQQYYTLNPQPNPPPQQPQQLTPGQPQPQHFPRTPQAPGQQYYAIPQNGIPVMGSPAAPGNNGYPHSPILLSQQPIIGSYLPYPTQIQPQGNFGNEDFNLSPMISQGGDIIVKEKADDEDDVDTLPSAIHSEDEEEKK